MAVHQLSVREMQLQDIQSIADYWTNSDKDLLVGMGVDLTKIPERSAFVNMLTNQFELPLEEKKAYVIIWEKDGKSIGHCNLNPMVFEGNAHMHLHIWSNDFRRNGIGAELVKMSLPYFFEKAKIKNLYSEPYALNPAPNKTLPKVGFEFIKEYITVPGSINFEQPVKQWLLRFDKWKETI